MEDTVWRPDLATDYGCHLVVIELDDDCRCLINLHAEALHQARDDAQLYPGTKWFRPRFRREWLKLELAILRQRQRTLLLLGTFIQGLSSLVFRLFLTQRERIRTYSVYSY